MDVSEFIKTIETKGNMDLSVFREPRGVCRVLQLIIGTLAGLAIYGYEGVATVFYLCGKDAKTSVVHYSYPFQLANDKLEFMCNEKKVVFPLATDHGFSQYSEYFFFVCILSIIYCLIAIYVYSKCTASYETNDKYPLVDFVGTVILAVLWLFASAAWSHGLSGLKETTDPDTIKNQLKLIVPATDPAITIDKVNTSLYFGLNVSAILGCLSFFLWASDLWFLYKETPWFQGRRGEAVGSPA